MIGRRKMQSTFLTDCQPAHIELGSHHILVKTHGPLAN